MRVAGREMEELKSANEVVVRDSFQRLKFEDIMCVGTKGLA
jgi:hypothetical protein